MNWNSIVNRVLPYIFKIETPQGHGTGFLCFYNEDSTFVGIATACHVVEHANDWREPIRLIHHQSQKTVFCTEGDRVIFVDYSTDSAIVLIPKPDFEIPEEVIPLFPRGQRIDIGLEVGWIGFPGIEPYTPCFFSGAISAHQERTNSYLIDGVAINGVSGGPVLYRDDVDGVKIVGTVSAYRANRTGGGTLPGLLISQDVTHFHDVAKHIKDLDEARKQAADAKTEAEQAVGEQPPSRPKSKAGSHSEPPPRD